VDWLDLQRFITLLIMPLPLGLGLAVSGLLLSRRARLRWLGGWLSGAGLTVIWLSSLSPVAEALLGGLEDAYPPRAVAECRPAGAIVVLGGAMQPWLVGDARARLQLASDRVWEAARLYHAGCAPLIVVSAGGLIEPPVGAVETEAIAGLLVDLGVPRSALLLEAESRNTQGNAAFSRALLAPQGIERVLLVTSAWHLRRAMALFEGQGFVVEPMGADYRSLRGCRGLECWVPNAGALEGSGLAVKEYLGFWMQLGG